MLPCLKKKKKNKYIISTHVCGNLKISLYNYHIPFLLSVLVQQVQPAKKYLAELHLLLTGLPRR